jgi:endonuclease/exonuclease/phosphatase family metal-dependent hydrolase
MSGLVVSAGCYLQSWHGDAENLVVDQQGAHRLMRWALAFLLSLWSADVAAQTLRIATFNVSLNRRGAGLLLQELQTRPSEQARAIVAILQSVRPDIVLLNEFDHDPEARALAAFQRLLNEGQAGLEGLSYPFVFAEAPNSGVLTGHDLDGDGMPTGPRDAQGFGYFPGQYGMAVLSRYPIDHDASRSFTSLLWKDLVGAIPPDGFEGYVGEVQRLSSKAHWDVAVEVEGMRLHLLASHPTPPVFDGPEDMNGRRNHDEIALWSQYLAGVALNDDAGNVRPIADAPVVVLGDLNADPMDGDGRREAVRALLASPRLQDPGQSSRGGVTATSAQGGVNAAHRGPAAQDTADWRDDGAGNLRVDYVLPDAGLKVVGGGVFWPAPGETGHTFLGDGRDQASDHRLVWVDVVWPPERSVTTEAGTPSE